MATGDRGVTANGTRIRSERNRRRGWHKHNTGHIDGEHDDSSGGDREWTASSTHVDRSDTTAKRTGPQQKSTEETARVKHTVQV